MSARTRPRTDAELRALGMPDDVIAYRRGATRTMTVPLTGIVVNGQQCPTQDERREVVRQMVARRQAAEELGMKIAVLRDRPNPAWRASSQQLDARGADDPLVAAVEADEELPLAVVVGRGDEHRPLLPAEPAAAAVLAVEPAPEADERVALPLPADRRLLGVPREHPHSCGERISRSMTDMRTMSAGPPPTASRNSVSPEKHSSPLTTNATPSSECPGVAIASIRRPPVSSRPVTTGIPNRCVRISSCSTWSAWPCVRRTCVGVSPSRSIVSSSGSSGAPLSTNTARPPGSSPTTKAFDSHRSSIERSTIISTKATRPRCRRQDSSRDARPRSDPRRARRGRACAAAVASSSRSRSGATPASGAIGLAVPGAGPAVTRESALNTLLTGEVQSSLLGGTPPRTPLIELGAGPPPDTLVVLPPPGRTENDRYPIAVTPGPRGVLTSDSTRIDGLVSLADVAHGTLEVVEVDDPVATLERLERADRAERPHGGCR